MKAHIFLVALALGGLAAPHVNAADWIVSPSYYSHDPQTGQRVTQYTPIGPFYNYAQSDYLRSGYRHTRSSIQAGGSVDHMHIVEEFGRAVRPYGEWRFPYRPYSVPYPAWGAPFSGLGNYPPQPYGPNPTPHGGVGGQRPYNQRQPWDDGSYPSNRIRPRQPVRPHDGRNPYSHPGTPGPGPVAPPGHGHPGTPLPTPFGGGSA
jgi:hypothetical protein